MSHAPPHLTVAELLARLAPLRGDARVYLYVGEFAVGEPAGGVFAAGAPVETCIEDGVDVEDRLAGPTDAGVVIHYRTHP